MPVIIMTGTPCSGKTTRTNELKNFFEKTKNKKVLIVSEQEAIERATYDKNSYYQDSIKEKQVRADVMSHTTRLTNPTDVIIVDGPNYIKGYRYEIYCMTKLYRSPQCTIQCDIPVEHAWLWNEQRPSEEQYSREIFDALILRYEPPNNNNRWDSPLYVVTPEDELPFEAIYSSLYEVNAPKPNLSTQNVPLASNNYLVTIDKITMEIVNAILDAKKMGIDNNIKIAKYNVVSESSGNAPQLTRLRRQFLTYNKMKQIEIEQIPSIFIQYLNKNL